ncbi:ATP-dependent endonuclease [Nocardioides sp. SYSU D00038]|uniref:ATP-dependent nuclease n=1 Tax=Nocardioides sp. SYSU D00038 TaxID=2812554 RepID=UPI0019671FDD|nr:AAA family ATPase [Nocardioides sp. SYSU D00038]
MVVRVRLGSATLSSGDRIEFNPAGVTCVVGGNNVGKSQLLRDIEGLMLPAFNPIVLEDLQVKKSPASSAEVVDFVRANGYPDPSSPQDGHLFPRGGGSAIRPDDFSMVYQNGDGVGLLKGWFVWHASAGSLGYVASSGVGDGGVEINPGHPLVKFFRNGHLERELSSLAEQTFGLALTLDRVNGNVRLRVGTPEADVPPINLPTPEYSDAVAALPLLERQGDGVRSFVGLAVQVLTEAYGIMLVDEPEAFLHPGQARALGRWLARESAARDIQVVVATHDRDFVLGLVDAQQAPVRLMRLRREGDRNYIQSIDHSEVLSLWADPVMRYSNALQGLFHNSVVITESDGDCRFYAAVLDDVARTRGRTHLADDVLFVPSGGKQRMASMAGALTPLGVRTFAIADFDLLNDQATVVRLVRSLGGTWTEEMRGDYVAFADPCNRQQLWPRLKEAGRAAVPPGEPTGRLDALLGALRDVGLLVVPVGEMESFHRTIALHGSAWVSEMLEQRGHESCLPARDMLEPLLSCP